jgi:hypothetical protein
MLIFNLQQSKRLKQFLNIGRENITMRNDIRKKKDWMISLLTIGILIIGTTVFISTRIALMLTVMICILFVSAWLSKLVAPKTSNPILSSAITGFGVILSLSWMEWFVNKDHTLIGFLTEIGQMIAIISAPILVLLAIYGFIIYWKKQYPSTAKPPAKEDTEQLESEFSKLYLRSTGLWFVGWGIFGCATYFLLKAFGNWYYSNLIHGVIVEPPDNALWAIVALFLGIYISMITVNLLIKNQLGNEYEKHKNYYDFRMGFNNKKAGRAIGLLYATIVFGLIFINLTLYTRFTEAEIAIHRPYWITEHIHSYSEISSIQKITTVHQDSEDNFFVIEFSDGTSWRTSSYHTGKIPSYYPAILELASRKSNIPVGYITHVAGE